MNAAARLVHQHNFTRYLVFGQQLTVKQFSVVFLILATLISMLSIIYVTHANRVIYANYQRTLAEYNRLQAEQSQLLLERSALIVPAKVQQLAENNEMTNPDNNAIVIVRE